MDTNNYTKEVTSRSHSFYRKDIPEGSLTPLLQCPACSSFNIRVQVNDAVVLLFVCADCGHEMRCD
ncbi:MAG: hypothetical protein JW904_01395 [Spirochaetales bacterium]|nr:hypothetical protein [Spirochaetales bacterium]